MSKINNTIVKAPKAYMNPHLQTFKGVEWTSACLDMQSAIEGTVSWTLDWFNHERAVIDKHGVNHYSKPLYLE